MYTVLSANMATPLQDQLKTEIAINAYVSSLHFHVKLRLVFIDFFLSMAKKFTETYFAKDNKMSRIWDADVLLHNNNSGHFGNK